MRARRAAARPSALSQAQAARFGGGADGRRGAAGISARAPCRRTTPPGRHFVRFTAGIRAVATAAFKNGKKNSIEFLSVNRTVSESKRGGAAPGSGLARFPRFFNAKTMRVVGKEDAVSDGYAAFIPAARPAYDARKDVSLPLARRINAGYRLPNEFRPGEWAPLRRFCGAPQQEEDANGLLQSTRRAYQPVSWYTVLRAFFGARPPLPRPSRVRCLRLTVTWSISAARLLCQRGVSMHPHALSARRRVCPSYARPRLSGRTTA